MRRIFRMVGSERRTLYAVKRTLEREGIPTAVGARFWPAKCIRNYLQEDVYQAPYSRRDHGDGGRGPDVCRGGGRTRPEQELWHMVVQSPAHEAHAGLQLGPDGDRSYKKKGRYVERPKEEWVAVPVPDSGIPREWVDTARETMKGQQRPLLGGPARLGDLRRDSQVQGVRPQHDDP